MTITERTEVKVTSLSRGKRFYLLSGKLEASVARQRPFQPMRLMTPMAEAQVLGTKLTLYTTAKRTRLEVTEGAVRITKLGSEDSTKVSGGHYAVVAANTELKPLPLTGSIFREYWTNISGTAWTELTTNDRYPAHPDGRESVTNFTVFEMPANRSRNYGERFRGYIQPPETGQYTFWIAGRSEASLFLSPDENPDHRVHMAYSETRTQRDWEAKPAQTSGAIRLTAGKKYYFEVVHKAGTTGDFLAIAWKGPGHDRELVPFEVLSPYKPTGKERKP
jgi:hypothetical protein